MHPQNRPCPTTRNTRDNSSRRRQLLLAAAIAALAIIPFTHATTGPTEARLTVHDTSGYERHTGIAGNATIEDGQIRLNGSYLQTGAFGISPSAQTVAFRFILNSTKPASAGTTHGLWHDGATATTSRLFISNGETGTISIMPLATAHAQVTSTLGVSTNISYVVTWRFQHIPVTGPSFSSLSVDGAEWINVTSIGSLGSSSGGPKYVGISTLSGSSGPGNICNCTFEWFRYYNRVLNDSEIDELVNATAPSTGKELEYSFDEAWDYGPPLPAFSATSQNLTVNVDGSASFSNWPTGTLSYDWDWGDGTPHGDTAIASHTYMQIGIKNITLTVTHTQGQNASLTVSLSIHEGTIITVINNIETGLPQEVSMQLAFVALMLAGIGMCFINKTSVLPPAFGMIAEIAGLVLSISYAESLGEHPDMYMGMFGIAILVTGLLAYLAWAFEPQSQVDS